MILWETKPELDKRLLELEAQGLTQTEIAQQLSETFDFVISRDSVKNRLARMPRENIADSPLTEIMPYFRHFESVIRGSETAPKKIDLKAYFESLGRGKKRALVLSDLHIPFQDEARLQKAVDLGRGCDLVIRSDTADMYAISRFIKEFNIPLEVELDGIVRNNEYLSRVFEGVPIIDLQSNHTSRVAKAIQMPTSLEFLVKVDILDALARPFANIFAHDTWFIQVLDSIFTHAEVNSKVPGKPVVDTYEWFVHRGHRLGVKPFRTLVQGHTHKMVAIMEGDTKLFEAGCLCLEMPYTKRDTKYMRVQNPGCVIITWEDGRSVLNQCREYAL